jgi:tripartite-type tricarboxylate transporter receptor subunit TctC
MLRIVMVLVAALLVETGVAQRASAQAFPSRPVKFILPFGPGSGADITTRMLSEKLAQRWGKAVVIENRPGGDGMIAINSFIAANDEHTLLYVPVGTFAVHPYMHEKLSYNADRDLIPVANVTTLILSAAIPSAMKPNTLRELTDLIRAEPNKHNAAAAPGNSDFLLQGYLKGNNLDMAKVPYKDIMQGPGDLSEGRIQLLVSSLAIVTPLQQAGRVKVLAVTSRKRAPSAPDVPTVAEAGFPALEIESMSGVFAPRGMPMETRQRIADDIKAVLDSDPSIAKRLEATGQVVDLRGPAEFTAGIKDLRDKLAAIAKLVGMKEAQPQ